jgi:hypothetical protein
MAKAARQVGRASVCGTPWAGAGYSDSGVIKLENPQFQAHANPRENQNNKAFFATYRTILIASPIACGDSLSTGGKAQFNFRRSDFGQSPI